MSTIISPKEKDLPTTISRWPLGAYVIVKSLIKVKEFDKACVDD